MLSTFPVYKKGELKAAYETLPESDKEIIQDFLKYVAMTTAQHKLVSFQRSIAMFRLITEKSLNQITLDDVREWLRLLKESKKPAFTCNGLKAHVKRFLKWYYKDWSVRFDELRNLKLQRTKISSKRYNYQTFLTEPQVQTILDKEELIERKAMFMLLAESALRPCEAVKIRWNDIKFDIEGDVSEIYIHSPKTDVPRIVYIKNASFYLKRLKESAINEWVFPAGHTAKGGRTKNPFVATDTVGKWLRAMGKAVGLKVHPYLLRHMRASQLYLLAKQNKMSKDVVTQFMGHSEDMSEIYTQLDPEVLKQNLIKSVYKLEVLPEEKKTELEKQIEELKKKMETEKRQHDKELIVLMDMYADLAKKLEEKVPN